MYKDRIDAGFELANRLSEYKNSNGVVLAVPRGGVPIGYVVAKELHLPLEIIFSKKIGHPFNKEYAIGAVSLMGSFIVSHEDVSPEYIQRESERIRKQLQEMKEKFVGKRQQSDLKNKIVILVDDGIATGNTLMATINILKKNNPAKVVVAAPVASQNAVEKIKKHVDQIVCPLIPQYFEGVGAFYENFDQVTDEEVLYYLEKLEKESPHASNQTSNQ